MKLRNKKTGEIVEDVWWDEEVDELCVGGDKLYFYNSLAELNSEWEDYEEPKEDYWYITENGAIGRINLSWDTKESIENHKSIGNYFETNEEAEKAVEKLKAWKRLKDKGFRLSAVVDDFFCLDIYMKGKFYNEIKQDLKIVFGGEE